MTVDDEATNGIIISYMLTLGGATTGILYTMSNLSKMAVSIQRLRDYATWEDHEKPFTKPKPEKENWPTSGKIEMKDLTVRYRRGLPLVLDHVNFTIESGQNVAIVGRTGSGKSTTLLALMRILEMSEKGDENFADGDEADGKKPTPGSGIPLGSIIIDGQRIDKIGLHYLRSKMAIIPQDPFLLQGSLKFNVDPFNKYEEIDIINALKAVKIFDSIRPEDIIDQKVKEIKDRTPIPKRKKLSEKETKKRNLKIEKDLKTDKVLKRLKDFGPELKDKLNYEIESGGSNLSLGQRQLICIARALVMKPKILLMDEATANIDQKTDSIIQSVIKEQMTETTVVTIAHRLITIVQYDKILILEDGKKKEEGAPIDLMKNEGSYFRALVMEGGKEFFEKMVYAAEHKEENVARIFA